MEPNFHALQLIAEIAIGIVGFSAMFYNSWGFDPDAS